MPLVFPNLPSFPTILRELIDTVISNGDILSISPPLLADDDTLLLSLYSDCAPEISLPMTVNEYKSLCNYIFTSDSLRVAVHGLKRILDFTGTPFSDLSVDRIIDTELMAYLWNPDLSEEDLTLSHVGYAWLGKEYPYKPIDIYTEPYPRAFFKMLAHDARLIYRLSQVLPSCMDADLQRLYREVELPLSAVLAQMHHVGIGVDRLQSAIELSQMSLRVQEIEQRIGGGATLNLLSDTAVYWLLYNLGVRFRDDDVNYARSVTTEAMEEIADEHPVVNDILEWRELSNILNFLKLAADSDRVHPTWHQTRGSTGRIFAREPAVQNVKREYKRLFIPAAEHVLIKADYKTMQIRILAHLSQDSALMEACAAGNDVHQRTAERLGITRQLAKAVNFGICFGITEYGLANNLNKERLSGTPQIELATAKTYIDDFFMLYPTAGEFLERECESFASRNPTERILRSPLGRLRRFGGKMTDSTKRRFKASMLQQIEADIVKKAMLGIAHEFRERGMLAKIVMMVHDSIWVDAPVEEELEARGIMETVMTNAMELTVPLLVDFG